MIRYVVLAALATATSLGTETSFAAERNYTFQYRDKTALKITVSAETSCAAYKKSAKMCYNILTGGTYDKPGRYPGEEEGLNIIDICANPINFSGT